MEEQQYSRLIYGLKLKVKTIKHLLCNTKKRELRNKFILLEDDIQSLIDDYEKVC